MSEVSKGNSAGNKGWRGKDAVHIRANLYMTFDGQGLCGNHVVSGKLRKCHYYCQTQKNYFGLEIPLRHLGLSDLDKRTAWPAVL